MLMPEMVSAQSVPEGIHTVGTGAPTLCGMTGPSLSDIERQVLSDNSFAEENSTDKYRVFNRTRDLVQMVFPRAQLHPFAMATCRKVVPNGAGSTIQRELRCDGTRAQCDAVFLEFKQLDDRVIGNFGR